MDETHKAVYAGRGAITWLPDIDRWAKVVAHFVKPGGIFYINEFHPVAQALDDEGTKLRLRYPCLERREPFRAAVKGSYVNPEAVVDEPYQYGWNHGLSRGSPLVVRPSSVTPDNPAAEVLMVRSIRRKTALPLKSVTHSSTHRPAGG